MVKIISTTMKLVVVCAFVSAIAFGGTQLLSASQEEDCDTPEGVCDFSDDCGCDWYCKNFLDHEYGGTCDPDAECCICFD